MIIVIWLHNFLSIILNLVASKFRIRILKLPSFSTNSNRQTIIMDPNQLFSNNHFKFSNPFSPISFYPNRLNNPHSKVIILSIIQITFMETKPIKICANPKLQLIFLWVVHQIICRINIKILTHQLDLLQVCRELLKISIRLQDLTINNMILNPPILLRILGQRFPDQWMASWISIQSSMIVKKKKNKIYKGYSKNKLNRKK